MYMIYWERQATEQEGMIQLRYSTCQWCMRRTGCIKLLSKKVWFSYGTVRVSDVCDVLGASSYWARRYDSATVQYVSVMYATYWVRQATEQEGMIQLWCSTCQWCMRHTGCVKLLSKKVWFSYGTVRVSDVYDVLGASSYWARRYDSAICCSKMPSDALLSEADKSLKKFAAAGVCLIRSIHKENNTNLWQVLQTSMNCYRRPDAPEQTHQMVDCHCLQVQPQKQLPFCLFTLVNHTCSAVLWYAIQELCSAVKPCKVLHVWTRLLTGWSRVGLMLYVWQCHSNKRVKGK